MAFADPQSTTLNAVAIPLPRTGLAAGTYTSADGNVQLSIRHNDGKRISSSIQLRQSKIVTDPLRPADYKPVYASVTLAVNKPLQGFSQVEMLDLINSLLANLAAGTDANKKKLLGLEN
jgi:hypothetical protein